MHAACFELPVLSLQSPDTDVSLAPQTDDVFASHAHLGFWSPKLDSRKTRICNITQLTYNTKATIPVKTITRYVSVKMQMHNLIIRYCRLL